MMQAGPSCLPGQRALHVNQDTRALWRNPNTEFSTVRAATILDCFARSTVRAHDGSACTSACRSTHSLRPRRGNDSLSGASPTAVATPYGAVSSQAGGQHVRSSLCPPPPPRGDPASVVPRCRSRTFWTDAATVLVFRTRSMRLEARRPGRDDADWELREEWQVLSLEQQTACITSHTKRVQMQ